MSWLKYASIFLVLVAFSLAASCGAASSHSGPEVFFPQLLPKINGGPDALWGGKLILDEEGCLRVGASADYPGAVPLWPASYELTTRGKGVVRIFDGEGQLVAQVGKEISMGGGGIHKEAIRENGIMKKAQVRELFERCPGDYWVVNTKEGSVNIRGRGSPR